MKMPQDFVDAINVAVKEVNPNAGVMTSGSFTLGTDFDDILYSEDAMILPLQILTLNDRLKNGEDVKAELIEKLEAMAVIEKRFAERFAEKRDELKKAMVDSCVETEKQKMAGTLNSFAVSSGKKQVNLREFVEGLQ